MFGSLTLRVEVTATGDDTTLSGIDRLVAEALGWLWRVWGVRRGW